MRELLACFYGGAPDLDSRSPGEVQDGTAAQRAYAEIIDPATPEDRRNALIRDLRNCCRLDTLAMVRLAGFLAQGAGLGPRPHT